MEAGGATRHTPPSRVEEPQDEHPMALLPVALPGHQNKEMYIVQMPRDQVYRVPPPENAQIVANYRKPKDVKKKKRNCGCISCCCKVVIALLVIFVLIAITLTILFLIMKPRLPAFSVTNLVVKNHEAVKHSKARPQYEILLTAKNPNAKYKVEYEKDYSEVSLLFHDKKVGAAKFPSLLQQPGDSSKVKVEVLGFHQALPAQMQKSMNSKNSDIHISFDLEIVNLWLRINKWVFNSHVACKFEVNTLRNHIKVLSEECHSSFRR